MSYRKIEVDTKTEAVKRVLRGEMTTAVATDLEIDRNSLSLWVRRALEAIHSNLDRKKRARRPVREECASNHTVQMRRLKSKIANQGKMIAEMRNSLRSTVEAPVPERCPACGCVRFYKNGMGKVHLEHLLGKKLNGADQTIPVQKFICVNCGGSTHLDGPPALFHWVTAGYRQTEGEKVHADENGHGRMEPVEIKS